MDELPCGGYANEDHHIQQQMQLIVEGKEPKQHSEGCGNCDCKDKACGCKAAEAEKAAEAAKGGKACKRDKCGGRAVLLHKGDPICQACLFKNMEYKARLLLENTFKVTRDSNLLVCLSGGPSSASLLALLLSIFSRYKKHKLFNRLACLHVQQQSALPEGYKERFAKETGLELQVIGIEQVMRQGERTLDNVRELLRQFGNTANSIDLLTVFRDRLITEFARKNGFDFVLKGLNADSMAAESFCYFAKGLGGNIPGLCSGSNSPFYYPLRNHSRKELQYYFHVRKIAFLAIKTLPDNLENAASSALDDQIREFIDTLQQMYSHTAPAIVRTAEKIEPNLPSQEKCTWCLLPGSEKGLCRRCLRVWEGRRKNADLRLFPLDLQQ